MPLVTRLIGPSPPAPHTVLLTVDASIVVGTAGLVLFRVAFFLVPTWIIPAPIGLVLQIGPRTRSLAVGFGAASVGWFAYSAAYFVFAVVGSAFH